MYLFFPIGQLADYLIVPILQDKLNSKPCTNQGFVLEGFPETYEQAKSVFGTSSKMIWNNMTSIFSCFVSYCEVILVLLLHLILVYAFVKHTTSSWSQIAWMGSPKRLCTTRGSPQVETRLHLPITIVK